ncbi:hypothetical protein ACFOJE_16800 [Azotobacter bryophylli]|uniref:Uncharacterized protein n=1 Tax=Azotobacter bryophylli TaxID=1986537 RepID=A0ABV7AXY3_9GAMM
MTMRNDVTDSMAHLAIRDINEKYRYEDTNPQGKRDPSLVSCGQCGNYNELIHIYDSKLKPHVENGSITCTQATDALDECCKELPSPRKRTVFYKKLSEKLGIEIS